MSLAIPAVYGAAALLVNSTVWIFGGYGQQATNGLYSLDVSKSWLTSSPPFSNLSSYGQSSTFLYPRYFSTMALGADGSSLWIYGGAPNGTDTTNEEEFAVFDTQATTWMDPQQADNPISGITPPVVFGQSAVRDSKGVIYYYGGLSSLADLNSTSTSSPAFLTMDTRPSNLTLAEKTSGNKGVLSWHTATLVNGTFMYIIGGAGRSTPNIYNTIYNIATSQWNNPQNKSAVYPSGRYGHTAVLSTDGSQIIVFGGTTTSNVLLNDVWTLNVITNQWTQRNTSGTAPSGIAHHNSVMVQNQMIVMLGRSQGVSNSVYVLDTVTWTWVTSFSPTPRPSPTNSRASSSTSDASISGTFTSGNSTSDDSDSSQIQKIPISTAGIAGIAVVGVFLLGIGIISVAKPRNRVKPLM